MKTDAQMNADEVARIRNELATSNDIYLESLEKHATDDDLLKMKALFARMSAPRPLHEIIGE